MLFFSSGKSMKLKIEICKRGEGLLHDAVALKLEKGRVSSRFAEWVSRHLRGLLMGIT